MRGRPAELALRLAVRGAADRRHHRDRCLAGGQAADPARDVPRCRRAGRGGERGEPDADRRGLVVGDVVDAGRAALDRRHGRRGGVVDVDERPDAGAVADDREAALADQLELLAVGAEAGAGAVEAAVAERDPLDPLGSRDELLAALDRVQRRAHRRHGVGVERVGLGLDRAAAADGGPAGERLRHDPAGARRERRGEQVLGALGPQPVRGRERAVEVARELEVAERGELVDDDVRPRLGDGREHRVAVERVGDHGGRAGRAQRARPRGRAGHADDVVAVGDEPADQRGADCAGGACDEDAHGEVSFCCDDC